MRLYNAKLFPMPLSKYMYASVKWLYILDNQTYRSPVMLETNIDIFAIYIFLMAWINIICSFYATSMNKICCQICIIKV